MGYSNGIISAPVNTDDVAQALGVSSHDVGVLCTSDKINKWAKYKPVRVDTPATITDAQRESVNFGISIPSVGGAGFSSASLVNNNWSYLKPDGTWWKRLDDFVGYNSQAAAPYGVIFPSNGACYIGDSFDILFPENVITNNLTLKEAVKSLGNVAGMYIGVMVEQGSAAPKYYTGPNILAASTAGNFSVRVPSAASSNKCTLFLTDRACANGALDSAAHIYPFFPDVERQVTFTSGAKPTYVDQFEISAWGTVSVGYNYVEFTATVKNKGNATGTFRNKDLRLSLNITDEYGTNVVKNRESYWSTDSTSFSLAANATKSVTLRFNIDAFTTKRNWQGMFSLDLAKTGGQYDALGGKQIKFSY